MAASKSHNDIELHIDTKGLGHFLLEAGVDASTTSQVMESIDEYLAQPEPESLDCFLVKPAALALDRGCIDDFILDILAHLGDPDW
jgi:hypothetical protein